MQSLKAYLEARRDKSFTSKDAETLTIRFNKKMRVHGRESRQARARSLEASKQVFLTT